MRTLLVTSTVLVAFACARPSSPPSTDAANPGIDSLNAGLVEAYRSKDPKAYGMLFTDTAVFEWPAFIVRGRPGLEAMARDNWPRLKDMELALQVSARRIGGNHATEFGAFQQSWTDSTRGRMIEYGRYVHFLVRDSTGWRIDRFAGFEDSTRAVQPSAARK